MRVHVAHSSGEFSDKPKQQILDAQRLCERAFHHGWWWLTGTEAGSESSLGIGFDRYAPRHRFTFHKGSTGDAWILTNDRHFAHTESEFYKVIDGEGGEFADRGPFRVTGQTPLGEITILSCHYLTRKSMSEAHRREANTRIAAKIGDLGREFGAGQKLCFYGGDQNMGDTRFDTFMGEPFTSIGDELDKHPDTGHGPIDVIASYDHDRRAKPVSWKVYDDSEFRLASDHFLCEGVYEINWPKGKQ